MKTIGEKEVLKILLHIRNKRIANLLLECLDEIHQKGQDRDYPYAYAVLYHVAFDVIKNESATGYYSIHDFCQDMINERNYEIKRCCGRVAIIYYQY
jgi:hypothetical protein